MRLRPTRNEVTPVSVLDAEDLVHARPAQVAVQHQHFFAQLGEGDGQVDVGHGLALLGQGRGDDEDLGRLVGGGEQERGADVAVVLGKGRFGFLEVDQLDRLDLLLGLLLLAVGIIVVVVGVAGLGADGGNKTQRRQVQQFFHLLGRFHRVVQVVEGKDQEDAAAQAQHQGHQQGTLFIGRERAAAGPRRDPRS